MASSKKRPLAELTHHLESFLQRHIPPGTRVLLGFSGGLDSRVLLDLLVRSPSRSQFSIFVLHVNHGISPNAGAWADFCRQLCMTENIPFNTVEIVVPRNSGLGLEAAAREARYAALLAQPADCVMLAHHRDDQGETLLLQLLRGAGVKGLAAMGEVRKIEKLGDGETKKILRPLLDVPRTTLLEYAQTYGLTWIEDESNLDLAYDRNFLRHQVLPELEKRFPASRTTLARSAAHLAEAAELLEELAVADAIDVIEHNRLDLRAFGSLSLPRAKNLLRYWMSRFEIDALPSLRLAEVIRQLLGAKSDAQVSFPLASRSGCYELRRYRHHAWIVVLSPAVPQDFSMHWSGEAVLPLGDMGSLALQKAMGAGICLHKLEGRGMTVRLRQGGERFQPDCSRPSRSLKNLLQESGLPPWQRASLPLLFCEGELVAVPGIGVACMWQATSEEEGIRPLWIPS